MLWPWNVNLCSPLHPKLFPVSVETGYIIIGLCVYTCQRYMPSLSRAWENTAFHWKGPFLTRSGFPTYRHGETQHFIGRGHFWQSDFPRYRWWQGDNVVLKWPWILHIVTSRQVDILCRLSAVNKTTTKNRHVTWYIFWFWHGSNVVKNRNVEADFARICLYNRTVLQKRFLDTYKISIFTKMLHISKVKAYYVKQVNVPFILIPNLKESVDK